LAKYLLEAAVFDMEMKKYSNMTIAFSLIFFICKLRNYPLRGEEQELQRVCNLT
jgi:hypothetical protein